MSDETENDNSNILPKRQVLYCGACGMPLEFCEYGPDYETVCNPWLKKHDAALFQELRGGASSKAASSSNSNTKEPKAPKPSNPWTTEERLTAFYETYVPEKIDGIPALLEKYAGKEEKLFVALVKKYGQEPKDPYYSDSEDEEEQDDEEELEEEEGDTGAAPSSVERKKRRGKAAKREDPSSALVTKVVVRKVAQKKKRSITIISGMETVPGLKLKDASKAFSKKFAGSSSVKKTADGKGEEIMIQGDHVYDVAEMIVDKFQVAETAVFIDMGDGSVVPLR